MTGDLTRKKAWPTPRLIRAAREPANIDQETLAAGVSGKAIVSLEGDKGETMDYRRLDILQKLQNSFEEPPIASIGSRALIGRDVPASRHQCSAD